MCAHLRQERLRHRDCGGQVPEIRRSGQCAHALHIEEGDEGQGLEGQSHRHHRWRCPESRGDRVPALTPFVARALVPVSMGPGGGPTKMYENPRVSRPLPLIWGWVFDAAASALMPTPGGLSGSF